MPVIKTIDAERKLEIDAAPNPQVDTSVYRAAAQQGAALAGLGQDIAQVAAHWQKREEETERTASRLVTQQGQQAVDRADIEAANSIPVDGKGWAESRLVAFDAQREKTLALVPEHLRKEFGERWDTLRGAYENKYLGQQITQRTNWAKSTLVDQTKAAEQAVFQNPDQLEARRKDLDGWVRDSPIEAGDKQKISAAYNQSLEFARAKGLVHRDPEAAQQAVGAVSSQPPSGQDPNAGISNGPPGSGGRARALAAIDRGANIKGYYQSSHQMSDVAAAALGGHAIQENGGRATGAPGDNGTAFGTFQWRGTRLSNLKKFAAERGSDWTDQKAQLDFAREEGTPGSKYADQGAIRAWRELGSARTPEEAVQAWMHFERPQGYSPDNPAGGHAYKDRLSNAKRLLGQSGDVSALDAGGRSASNARLVLGEAPEGAKNLTFEQRLAILNQAETRLKEISVEKRADIDIASDNAATAIQNTGDYTGRMPTRQDFVDAYGAEDGLRKADAFESQVGTARAVHEMQGQSQAQIEQTLVAARPVSSGENAQIEQARYDTLQKAAAQTLKARAADPAGYVMSTMPAVRAAWQDAQPGTPEYSRALRVTAEAQRSIGIAPDAMQLMPDAMAKKVTSVLKDEAVSSDQKFGSIVGTVFSTNDPEQQQAIFRQMVKEGAPAEMAGVMAAMQRGDQGAAKRLFMAATTDVSKLPGRAMAGGAPLTSQMMDDAIQKELLADGKLGDAIYGLSHGGADAAAVALRDAPLIKKSVELYVRRDGVSVEDAVARTAKDMWGDVKVYKGGWGVNAEAVVGNDVDGSALSRGLTRATANVFRPALQAAAARQLEGIDAKDAGARSVAQRVMSRALEAKLDASTFRTYAPGRIGLVDDATGMFYPGVDGRPLTIPIDDLVKPEPGAANQPSTVEVEGMTVNVLP